MLGVIVTGITGWTSLLNQANSNREYINVLKHEGTKISQRNQREIIGLRKDVEYTAATVKLIAEKLKVVN